MYLFALEPFWNDFYAVGGFAVGVVGFAVTIWQVVLAKRQANEAKKQATQAKTAADSAREAAAATLREIRKSFWRFIAANAYRLVNEARLRVEENDWRVASVRANDLADQMAQLGGAVPDVSDLVDELRGFGQVMALKAKQPAKKFAGTKWNDLLRRIQGHIDQLQAPIDDAGAGTNANP